MDMQASAVGLSISQGRGEVSFEDQSQVANQSIQEIYKGTVKM